MDATGKLDFINNAIAQDTDTFLSAGSFLVLGSQTAGGVKLRELGADEFVTVLLESVTKEVIAVPRAAILADQEGSYVYVVDDQNIARQRRVRLGQVTPETAGIADGLKEGEQVIVEESSGRDPTRRSPAPVTSIASRSETNDLLNLHRPAAACDRHLDRHHAGRAPGPHRILVAQLPDIVPPQVEVTTRYPGASAEVLEATVAQPLESKIVGVDNDLKSTSGNDGRTRSP